MVLVVDGEEVEDLVPHIGYMHRGGEKLTENMDYRQAIGYQDRTEYLAQFNAELCYCRPSRGSPASCRRSAPSTSASSSPS